MNTTPGFFLGVGPKTQGPKNSNSRNFSRKLKHFFQKKTQETGKCWEPFCLISQIYPVYVSDFTQKRQNIMFFQSKLKEFSKTQWKLKDFSKTQGQNSPQNCKNSRFRKLHLPTLPKKRLKKIPVLSAHDCTGHHKNHLNSIHLHTFSVWLICILPNFPDASCSATGFMNVQEVS